MSATNNKIPTSIFDSQDSNELKERQKLEELKRQAKVQQVKLDKRLNKQKIMMGAFLGQVLATDGDDEQMIREYFAIHFPDFLTRKSDKELFKSMIESLGGDIGLGEEIDSSAVNMKASNGEAENNHQTQSYSDTNNDTSDLLSDDNAYSTDINNPTTVGDR
nr:mobilization protein MobS [Psychrobacter sp.]